MKLIQGALRSLNVGLSHQFQCPQMIRALSTGANDIPNANSFESTDDFEQRIGNSSISKSFYQKLDRIEKTYDRTGFGTNFNIGNRPEFMDGLDESFNTLSDGMDGKLKKAGWDFEVDDDEIWEDETYTYRPDVNFDRIGETYDTKDLDLRRPGVWKPTKKEEFEVTTEEALRKADFRNVRFLANFLTDAGIIIKRSKTKISAKAQRKVVREIKTARAFGLMPFTTMGAKHFAFGKTMEDLDEDYEFETYGNYNFVDEEASQNPLRSP